MTIETVAIIGAVCFFAGIVVARLLMGNSRKSVGFFNEAQPYYPTRSVSPTPSPVDFSGVPRQAGSQPQPLVGNDPNGVDVILTATGSKKIAVIKAIREMTQLGLAEAKSASESVPHVLFTSVNEEFAAHAKAKLESAGASAEIRRKL